jgi:hypothetical protein
VLHRIAYDGVAVCHEEVLRFLLMMIFIYTGNRIVCFASNIRSHTAIYS